MTINDSASDSPMDVKRMEWDHLSEWFDTLYPRTEDIPFYSAWAGRCAGDILELGCGSGRITEALATNGRCDVVGVDLSPRQLELARRRLAALGPHALKRIDLVVGDMTSMSLGRQFALIVIPYSGLLELRTSDQRVSTLDVCRRHLQEGGTLVIDTAYIRNAGSNPARPADMMMLRRTFKHPTDDQVTLQHFEVQQYEPNGGMLLTIILDSISRADGIVRRKAFELRRCYASPKQLTAEFQSAGFVDVQCFAEFSERHFSEDGDSGCSRVVFVAR
ncbi:MAG TPA: class I SAM-dependent methyltransferase [Bryobacteraceae bacterium]|jgi:SAM-dependent methyltransferase